MASQGVKLHIGTVTCKRLPQTTCILRASTDVDGGRKFRSPVKQTVGKTGFTTLENHVPCGSQAISGGAFAYVFENTTREESHTISVHPPPPPQFA
ncbi:DDT domain-containing protein [Anopheles sinensis]|uniref:DDT domain-containing protein n=1 Tax=Anopheles sinensis TaxID=74873 RepID=A0A084WHT2_ANOSI|nr:DDT domain-containing protein [Anopheles sinensis]